MNVGLGKDHSCKVCYGTFSEIESSLPEISRSTGGTAAWVLLHDGCITVCRGCLNQFVALKISEKTVPIPCMSQGCDAFLPRTLVEGVLQRMTLSRDNSLFRQYDRLERLADDPTLVVCSRCDELVAPNSGGLTTTNTNQLQCLACEHLFCKDHGDRHQGMSCSEYLGTADAKQVLQTERELNVWTKPCSRCGVLLQKSHGCNMVTCGNCHRVMCYTCGTHEFLEGDRHFRCTKCGYVARYRGEGYVICLFALLALALYLLISTAWAVVFSVIGILSGCFCGCFRCGQDLVTPNNEDHQGAVRMNPLRGFLAVLALIFLHFLRLIELCTGEFVDDLLPPGFKNLNMISPAPEIPTLDTDHSNSEETDSLLSVV